MQNIRQKVSVLLRGLARKAGMVLVVVAALVAGYLLRGGPVAPSEAPRTAASQPATQEQAEIWTCSMHPQIRQPKPGRCPICHMELVPVRTAGGAGPSSERRLAVSAEAAKLMEIETAPVERKLVTVVVNMVGKVDFDETRLAAITARVPGRLERLYVDYTGIAVNKGDHLVELYSPDLIAAQAELLGAITAAGELEDSNLPTVRQTAEATVKAAREKLRLWGLTEQQVAEIEKQGKAADRVTIYAPIGGIVIEKHAVEGAYVETGAPIYAIADLSEVWVKLEAYESDLAVLRYGQKVEFTTVADPGKTFTGTIAFINPVLDEQTRTVKVRVNALNTEGRLKPGMFVKAHAGAQVGEKGPLADESLAGKWICPMHPDVVKPAEGTCDKCGMALVRAESLGYAAAETPQAAKPLVIPASAPLVTGERAVVYVEVPGADRPTYEGREIVLGPRAGDLYIVRGGLQEGERVVTRGAFKIDSALQIQAKPSMMNPQGAPAGAIHHHGLPAAERSPSREELRLGGHDQPAGRQPPVPTDSQEHPPTHSGHGHE